LRGSRVRFFGASSAAGSAGAAATGSGAASAAGLGGGFGLGLAAAAGALLRSGLCGLGHLGASARGDSRSRPAAFGGGGSAGSSGRVRRRPHPRRRPRRPATRPSPSPGAPSRWPPRRRRRRRRFFLPPSTARLRSDAGASAAASSSVSSSSSTISSTISSSSSSTGAPIRPAWPEITGRFRHHAQRGLELFDGIVGRDQHRVGFDPHRHAIARLDQGDMFALVVDQVVDDADRRFQQHLFRPLAGALFLKRAQDLQRHAVIGPDQAGAVAMRARLGGRFQHARAQALAAHLHQAKARDAADLNAGAVGLQLVLQALFDGERCSCRSSMSMKSMTISPARSRRRNWRATSSAASRLVFSAVSSIEPSFVARPEFTSIATSASVTPITM
jgi:hypothetical protein